MSFSRDAYPSNPTNTDLYIKELYRHGHQIGAVYLHTPSGTEHTLVWITTGGRYILVNDSGVAKYVEQEPFEAHYEHVERRLDWLTWRQSELTGYSHGPLSNFYVERDGLTLEHRFAALKTTHLGQKRKVLEAKTPGRAKKIGKLVQLRSDWDEIKADLMMDLLLKKFMGNPFARQYLFATDLAYISEKNTWNDRIWGVDLQNQGNNWLGKALMYVREELRD